MHVSKVYEMPVDIYGDVRTLVRGLPYQCPDDWEDVLDSLDEDSNLYLVKEPDNPKDKLAIAAYLDDRRVGYVAASDNGKIWLYLTDEKMPCKFIERFDASFKISFDNPRSHFEGMSFEEIYKDNKGLSTKTHPVFKIPFLTNPKDKNYDWYDDKTYIADLEWLIPDFRRKLATRMIVLVGQRNSEGDYCYYLPYISELIAYVEDSIIQGLIDRYGFVIALPDVPMLTHRDAIFMDLHVTILNNTNFKEFSSAHHSQIVFNLSRDYVDYRGLGKRKGGEPYAIYDFFPIFGITLGETTWKQVEDMGNKVEIWKDGPTRKTYMEGISLWDDGGKGVFTRLFWIQPYDNKAFPPLWESKGFSWNNSYDEWLEVFKEQRFKIKVTEEPSQKEFSGRNTLSAKFEALSADGILLFKMDFDYGKEGFLKSSPKTLNSIIVNYEGVCSQVVRPNDAEKGNPHKITNTPEGDNHVSMGVIVPKEGNDGDDSYTYECRISDKKKINLIKEYMKRYEEGKKHNSFVMIGKPCAGQDNLYGFYSLDGETFFNYIFDEKIKGWIGEVGSVLGNVISYQSNLNTSDILAITLSVSKRKVEEEMFKQASEEAMESIKGHTYSKTDSKNSDNNIIQEAVFKHCIFEVFGLMLTNTPNDEWKYESFNIFGLTYETYVFSAPNINKARCKKCEAIVNRNRNTNFKFSGLNADTVLSLLYHYRKVFDSSYSFEQCKEEYHNTLDDSIGSIFIETIPCLSICRSDGYSTVDSKTAKYDVLLYTTQYNKKYIDKLISEKKLITIF